MQRTAAGYVLACLIVILAVLASGCGQSGTVKGVASSLVSSKDTTAAPTAVATRPAGAAPAETTPTAAAPTAGASAAPTSGTGSAVQWLWVALAAMAFIGLIAAIARAHRRHAAARGDWRARLIDAYAKGAALHDAMASAETPGVLDSDEAGTRWSDIQNRADDFGQLLYSLQESAADERDRICIAQVLASLQAVRSAMATERSSPDTAGAMSNDVRDRLSFFGSCLRGLHEPSARPA